MITDRTKLAGHHGDCFIVTGSIGPAFQPKLFNKHKNAMAFAKEIEKAGKQNNVWPEYNIVVEFRYQSSMYRMKLED